MKLTQSLVAIAALGTLTSTLSFAGGDINPITVFEQEVPYVEVTPVPIPKAPPPEPVHVPVHEPAPAPAPEPVVVVAPQPLGLYIAGGLTDVSVSPNGKVNFFSDKVGQDRQIGFTGRLGYDFMDYLGAELRGTYGFSNSAPKYNKFKQIGAYLKPNYDIISDSLNLYGLLGASKTNHAGEGINSNDIGFSYGAGLDYKIPSTNISVFTDVVNYMEKSNTPAEWGLTLGAAYQF